MANNPELDGKKWVFIGATFAAKQERDCDRCKYPIKYFFALTEQGTENKIVVGSECVKILTGKTPAEHVKEIKDQKRREAAEQLIRQRMQELESFKAEHKQLFDHFEMLHKYTIENNLDHEFILSLASYYSKFDTLTLKQLEAASRITMQNLEQYKANMHRKSEIANILADLMLCDLGRWDGDFFKSLQSQFNVKGWLSEKQYVCLVKMHQKYQKQIAARLQSIKVRKLNESIELLNEVKEKAAGFYKSLKIGQTQRETGVKQPNGMPDGLNSKWYQYWNAIKEIMFAGHVYRRTIAELNPKKDYPEAAITVKTRRYVADQMELGGEHIDALNAALGHHWNESRKNLANQHSPAEIARMFGIEMTDYVNDSGPVECATCYEKGVITFMQIQDGTLKNNIAVIASRREKTKGQHMAYFVCDKCREEWR